MPKTFAQWVTKPIPRMRGKGSHPHSPLVLYCIHIQTECHLLTLLFCTWEQGAGMTASSGSSQALTREEVVRGLLADTPEAQLDRA